MTDIAILTRDDGSCDGAVFAGDLVRDDSLRAAVLVSLLTDAEVLEAPGGDPRGWWGDALNADRNDRIGSQLWTLRRAKRTPEVLGQAKRFAEAALAWLVTDNLAQSVTVAAAWRGADGLDLDIALQQPGGTQRIRLLGLWTASFSSPFAEASLIADRNANTAALLAAIYFEQYPELINE